VDDAERFESQPMGLAQVFFDHSFYIAGWNTVKIKDVGDRYAEGFGRGITGGIAWHDRGPLRPMLKERP